MSRISCSALLFDLDGVLIDSTPAVERVWRRWAVEHGFDPGEVIHRAHGRPSIVTIREYLPDRNHDAENRIVENSEIADLEGVVPLPGALELLTGLPPERWTIVTSCTRPLAEVRIRVAGLPVPKFIVTSSDVKHGKPHPEPYLAGASILGFPASTCVVFEDVPAGIRAGKSAEMKVVAIRSTAAESDLRKAGADCVIDNLAHLKLEKASSDGLILSIQE